MHHARIRIAIIGMLGVIAAGVLVADVRSSADVAEALPPRNYSCARDGYIGTIEVSFQSPGDPSLPDGYEEIAHIHTVINPPSGSKGDHTAVIMFIDEAARPEPFASITQAGQDGERYLLTGEYERAIGRGPVEVHFTFGVNVVQSVDCHMTLTNLRSSPDAADIGIQVYTCTVSSNFGSLAIFYRRSDLPDQHGALVITEIGYELRRSRFLRFGKNGHVRVEDKAGNVPVLETTQGRYNGKYRNLNEDEYVRSRPGAVEMTFTFKGVRLVPFAKDKVDPTCTLTVPDFV